MIQLTGITRILNKVKRLDRLNQPTYIKRILRALSEHGYNEVNVRYMSADFDNKKPDVNVNIVWEENNVVAIQADGVDVLFLEFGTGVHYNSPRNYPQIDNNPRVAIGGYGKHHGRQQSWYYPRENNPSGTPKQTATGVSDKWNYTRGTPSAKGLYYAIEKMKKEVIEIIRGVIYD